MMIKFTKTDARNVDYISASLRSTAKFAYDVHVDGELIGTIQRGKVGHDRLSPTGYRTGWVSEGSGWIMFDPRGKRIKPWSLLPTTRDEAVERMLDA